MTATYDSCKSEMVITLSERTSHVQFTNYIHDNDMRNMCRLHEIFVSSTQAARLSHSTFT